MKTIKVSEETHELLTQYLGEQIFNSGQKFSYDDAINALLDEHEALADSLDK